ncbi:uncharacterized protein LOC133785517 [Humulus lupulus]|uniref:uncharacterized protein LOC133785517 n=1 Tax=Humulus lupulus TaxID=3486 RepID=UPI002B411C93|nr:uncharacterized protein LOC133785517 [Humulus lupulus]
MAPYEGVDIQKIQQQLQILVDRHRKYVDRRRIPMEFEVGDKDLLKIAPLKAVMQFDKKGKLSPRKYAEDPSHVLSYYHLDVDPKICYEEKPVKNLDRKDKELRNKTIPRCEKSEFMGCKLVLA